MTSEALQCVSLQKKRESRGLEGRGKGAAGLQSPPQPGSPPMISLQAQREGGLWAPGVSIPPVTGLGSTPQQQSVLLDVLLLILVTLDSNWSPHKMPGGCLCRTRFHACPASGEGSSEARESGCEQWERMRG